MKKVKFWQVKVGTPLSLHAEDLQNFTPKRKMLGEWRKVAGFYADRFFYNAERCDPDYSSFETWEKLYIHQDVTVRVAETADVWD